MYTMQVDVQCILQLMMTLLYVKTHVWTCTCVTNLTLVHPAADDDFAICAYVVQVLNMCELP